MKTVFKTSLTLACLVVFIVNIQAADYKSKRILTKTFKATDNSTLSVSNEYGAINITEWDKNEVSFEVTITATAKKQADADEIVKTANVNFAQSGNMITAKTTYSNLKNCNCSRSVDYQIMVPKNIHYQLKNGYGNIAMGNAKGKVLVAVEYGNFKGADLSGDENMIKIEYGNIDVQRLTGNSNSIKAEYAGNINIGTSNNLSVKMEYSKMKVGTTTNLEIKSEYSDLSVQKAKTFTFASEYENYTIGEVDVLEGKAEYTNVVIGQLNKALVMPIIEYGKLDIKNVSSSFETINVKAAYTPVDVKFETGTSFNVNATTQYGTVSVSGNSKVSKTSRDNKVTVVGKVGSNDSPKASVIITNEYSLINLK